MFLVSVILAELLPKLSFFLGRPGPFPLGFLKTGLVFSLRLGEVCFPGDRLPGEVLPGDRLGDPFWF